MEGAIKVSHNVEIAPRRQQVFTFWVMPVLSTILSPVGLYCIPGKAPYLRCGILE